MATHKRRPRKKHKTTPKTTTTTRSPAVVAQALLDAYCKSVAAQGYADVTLFDNAMRPLLTRGVMDSAYHTIDPSLAADATALLNIVTASLLPAALAQVPPEIRAAAAAVRTEKQAILQHLVSGANGDPSGFLFLGDAANTVGGVQPQLVNIGAFLQANCPPGLAPAPSST